MADARRIDRAARVAAAPPERLDAAQLAPAAPSTWRSSHGSSLAIKELQPVAGGTFCHVLSFGDALGKTSAETDDVIDRVVEPAPPDRVVQGVDVAADAPAFAGTMRMSGTFRRVAGGTGVAVAAGIMPAGIRAEDHAVGLASSLDTLARYLEP